VPNYAPTFTSDFVNLEIIIGEVYAFFYPGFEDKNEGDTLTLSFYPKDYDFLEFSDNRLSIFPTTRD